MPSFFLYAIAFDILKLLVAAAQLAHISLLSPPQKAIDEAGKKLAANASAKDVLRMSFI